jgi:hypothetical protein
MDWDSIIDAAVYRSNGLRMPWSHKGRKSDSVYLPSLRITFDGPCAVTRVDDIDPCDHATVTSWLSRMSICAGVHDKHSTPPGAVTHILDCPVACHATNSSSHSRMSDAEVRVMLAALPPEYVSHGLRFRSVHHRDAKDAKDGQGLLGALVSTLCRYCKIAGREHHSNNVYFVVRWDGEVEQMCHASKCAGRRVRVGRLPHAPHSKHSKRISVVPAAPAQTRVIARCMG